MDTLDLHLILEKYNQQILYSLKNEFMISFKKDLLKDIKTEIYNLFIDDKYTKNTTICGFKRTRQRGHCKRTVKGFVCPYHLKQIKNNSSISELPDELPDEKLYGKHIFTTKNEDYIDIEKRKTCKKDLFNIKIYDYNKYNLPILKYNFKKDLNEIKVYYNEIFLLNNIDIPKSNNCNIKSIYKCKIYNKNIKILDKYENNGYNKIKLIEYNIDPILESEK